MATALKLTKKAAPEVKEYVFLWEGKNKAGQIIRGRCARRSAPDNNHIIAHA